MGQGMKKKMKKFLDLNIINEKIRERDALYTKEKEALEQEKIEASEKSEQRQKEIEEMSKTLKGTSLYGQTGSAEEAMRISGVRLES